MNSCTIADASVGDRTSTTMAVVVCEAPQRLVLAQRPIPSRQSDEVLIRIRRVGICGTDMHIVRGKQPYLTYPRVMGHELAGEVVEVSRNSSLPIGAPVYVMPYLSCGHCSVCRRGLTNCCRHIEVLGVHRDGGLAEYLAVSERFVRSAEGMSLDEVAMIEFLSIGAHAVRRASVASGMRVLIFGAGPIGMAAALFARQNNARVCVVDSRKDRLDFCSSQLAAEDVVLTSEHLIAQLTDLSGGELFDVVIDATGNRAAMEAGFEFVAHGGTYVLLSIVNDRISFSDPDFHRRELTLLGSRNATLIDFERVAQAIRAGKVPTRALNTHRTQLSQLVDVLPTWMSPAAGVIKGIVEC